MNSKTIMKLTSLAMVLAWTFTGSSLAKIETVKGPTFNLTAKDGFITTPDGGAYLMWGYALDGGTMQYPGPTLDVNE